MLVGSRDEEEEVEKHILLSISGQVGIWASAQERLILSHPAGPLSPLASKWLSGFTRLHLLFSARGPAQTVPAGGAEGVLGGEREGRDAPRSGSSSSYHGDKGAKT